MALRFPSPRILAGFLVVLTIIVLIVAFRNRKPVCPNPCPGCTFNSEGSKWSEKTPWRPPAAYDADPPECDIRDKDFELLWIADDETNDMSVAELVLNDTLVVDGCLLDCNAVRLGSSRSNNATKIDAITRNYQLNKSSFSQTPTSDDPSIVAVRNGGVLRSCRMGLRLLPENNSSKKEQPLTAMKINELYDQDEDTIQEMLDYVHEEMGELGDHDMKHCVLIYPNAVVPDAKTVLEDRDAKVRNVTLVYETMPVTGVRCDEGDCHLVDVDCIDYRGITKHCNTRNNTNADVVPLLGNCFVAKGGAGDVRIRGSSLSNTVAAYGLFVNATTEEEVALSVGSYSVTGLLANITTTTQHHDVAPMRLFVDDTTIANQLKDGISIFGGDAITTIRIADTHLESNGRDGIRLVPDWIPRDEDAFYRMFEDSTYLGTGGLETLAIIRGSVRNNGEHGVHLSWTDQWSGDVYPATVKTNTTVFVSDTHVSGNFGPGLWVERDTRSGALDIAIVGAVFDGNRAIKKWPDGGNVVLEGNLDKVDIRHVVSKDSPAGTGLSIAATNSSVIIQDSVVVRNGLAYPSQRPGIALSGPRRVNLTNVVITNNGDGGLSVKNVRNLFLQGVDSTDNRGHGISIWAKWTNVSTPAELSRFNVHLTDIRTCRNTKSGISFDTEEDGCTSFAISGERESNKIVSCGNEWNDYSIWRVREFLVPRGSFVGDSCWDDGGLSYVYPPPSSSPKYYDSSPKFQDFDSYIEYYNAYMEYMESRNSSYASVAEDSQAVQESRKSIRVDEDYLLCGANFRKSQCQVVDTNCTMDDCLGYRVILAADGTTVEDHYQNQTTTGNLTV